MEENKTRVFLTGATGVMGMAGLKELSQNSENYEITVLARDSIINRKKLSPFEKKGVKVIWGDLLDPNSLREGIKNADIVLHVGGMVSPLADWYPEKTLKVNLGSIRLITRIAREIEDSDSKRTIKVVYIGSVSQYGSKLPPNHWGKAGDKLNAAKLDAYAVSKIIGERILVESGLRKWVSLRQTAILHPGLLNKADDPISFHVPFKGVLEWISVEDSGRLLERVCRNNLPEKFWCNFYNVGGGEKFRLTNLEFEKGLLKAMGCPPPEKIFEPNWFATDNFHGIWFSDSDNLDNLLHYRDKNDSFQQSLVRMKKELPFYFKLAPLAPSFLLKKFMKRVALTPGLGPLSWLRDNNEERIRASWGSRQKQHEIPGWKDLKVPMLSKTVASSTELTVGNTEVKEAICDKGHKFKISEALKAGGHGCPYCLFGDSKVNCPENYLSL